MRIMILALGFGIVVVGVTIQAIPYGRAHANPPVQQEPTWSSAETRALFMQACGDCHSNETRWPWYSNLAPVSWLVQRDVDEGRDAMNVSDWPRKSGEAHEAATTVRDGEMPPMIYLVTHPEARVTGTERDTLIAGLLATFGAERGGDRGRR